MEPVCCSMSSSNCCFLTCIQVSQEAGQVVWYSHLLENFSQFIVIHTLKGFGIVNKADVFLELACFFDDPMDVGNLISGSSAFSKTSLNIWKFTVHVLLKFPYQGWKLCTLQWKCRGGFFFRDFNFIYFWLSWIFLAVWGLSLVMAKWGYSLLWCVDFSTWWLLLMPITTSRTQAR